jgi:hypothetical protein
MFSSLIVWVALAQVPGEPSAVGEATKATPSQPSERQKAELRSLVERRKQRRARAAADWRRERAEERRTAEQMAPFLAAQQQAEAARLHLWAQQARMSQMLYPYGYPWYPYPWPRRSGPILLGPFPEPGPLPGQPSGPIPLGPFPQAAPLPVSPLSQ